MAWGGGGALATEPSRKDAAKADVETGVGSITPSRTGRNAGLWGEKWSADLSLSLQCSRHRPSCSAMSLCARAAISGQDSVMPAISSMALNEYRFPAQA